MALMFLSRENYKIFALKKKYKIDCECSEESFVRAYEITQKKYGRRKPNLLCEHYCYLGNIIDIFAILFSPFSKPFSKPFSE